LSIISVNTILIQSRNCLARDVFCMGSVNSSGEHTSSCAESPSVLSLAQVRPSAQSRPILAIVLGYTTLHRCLEGCIYTTIAVCIEYVTQIPFTPLQIDFLGHGHKSKWLFIGFSLKYVNLPRPRGANTRRCVASLYRATVQSFKTSYSIYFIMGPYANPSDVKHTKL
jgi:hypothetical protein